MRVVALVDDLIDRSRLQASWPDVAFARAADAVLGADAVVIDLVQYGALVGAVRQAAPEARLVCFGPHVDTESADAARREGADLVWPRSRFFRDPTAALP